MENINNRKRRPIRVGHVVDRTLFEEILNSKRELTPEMSKAIKHAIKDTLLREELPYEKEVEVAKLYLIEHLLKNHQQTSEEEVLTQVLREQYIKNNKSIKTPKVLQTKRFQNVNNITRSQDAKYSTLLIKRAKKRERTKE